jgi:hypothetical protein
MALRERRFCVYDVFQTFPHIIVRRRQIEWKSRSPFPRMFWCLRECKRPLHCYLLFLSAATRSYKVARNVTIGKVKVVTKGSHRFLSVAEWEGLNLARRWMKRSCFFRTETAYVSKRKCVELNREVASILKRYCMPNAPPTCQSLTSVWTYVDLCNLKKRILRH